MENTAAHDVLILEMNGELSPSGYERLNQHVKEILLKVKDGDTDIFAIILDNGLSVAAVVHPNGSIDIRGR